MTNKKPFSSLKEKGFSPGQNLGPWYDEQLFSF